MQLANEQVCAFQTGFVPTFTRQVRSVAEHSVRVVTTPSLGVCGETTFILFRYPVKRGGLGFPKTTILCVCGFTSACATRCDSRKLSAQSVVRTLTPIHRTD